MNVVQPGSIPEQLKLAPLRYRPDIDGLRAIAVLPVLAYHAFPQLVPGGFIGVDIFFVISGYLITGIIQQQMLEKKFSIADFYARRIRRIFPALIVVVLVTFMIGWFVLPPRDLQSLGTNIAGGAVFAQNFILLGQVGYFDLAADKKPLLHLWSLGIEEQYYIVWPVTLLLIRRCKVNALAIVAALTVASFVLCVVVYAHSPDQAFYLPVTRAWELLVGSALALWQSGRSSPVGPGKATARLFREIAAVCALLAIALALWTFNSHTPYPGYFTLVPVLAAAVLLGISGTLVQRHILSAYAAVFVGLISYPLYLWHFPLIAYARLRFFEGVPLWVLCGILIASAVLTWLTYRLVERPIRFGKKQARFKIGALLGGMAVLGLIGLVADKTNGLPIRIPVNIRGLLVDGSETGVHWRASKCLLLPDQSAADFAPECAGDGRHPLMLIWGDSYATAFYPGLNHFAAERGFDVAEFTASACAPLIGFVSRYRRFCKGANDYVLERIAQLKPDVIILDSTWRDVEADVRPGLEHTVESLRALNVKKIVLLGPVATWLGDGLPTNLLDYYFENGVLLPERTWYRSNDAWTRPADAFLEAQAKTLGIEFISARKILCNEEGCLARIGPNGSQLTAFDNGHLTVPGSIFLAEHVLDRLLDFNH